MKRPPAKPARRPTDRKPGRKPDRKPDRKFFKPQSKPESGLWLYGIHAVKAALANPKRFVRRAVVTERAAEEIGAKLLGRVKHETADMHGVSKILPEGAVHQGVGLLVEPLPRRELDDILDAPRGGAAHQPTATRRIVLIMDQVTDPHNAGAILRTAAAFGVTAVVVQDRHSPPETGVLAKAASGALDIIPVVTVVNIARTLEDLGKREFWRIALAGDGERTLADAGHSGDVALVLGSEGAGVRRLVRENCDIAAFVPIASAMESLNVSNAAAIALYELTRG
jgi:23S rRNA (guanosine2251-2'-O)-methyltransferase